MMFYDLAKQRYSVRKFDTRPVEEETLARVLAAAQLAPTATNAQPQRILVLRTAEALARLAECTPFHFHAPLALVVCYDDDTAWTRPQDGQRSGEVDVGIVGTHLMLAAAELGLGTTWVMYFDADKLRDACRIPDNLVPTAIFPMGYPAGDAAPHAMHFQRKPLEETVFYDSF